jgi:hypothetical protein
LQAQDETEFWRRADIGVAEAAGLGEFAGYMFVKVEKENRR